MRQARQRGRNKVDSETSTQRATVNNVEAEHDGVHLDVDGLPTESSRDLDACSIDSALQDYLDNMSQEDLYATEAFLFAFHMR